MYEDFYNSADFVAKYDKEVGDAMNLELKRQQRNIELIASENIVSPAVMAAMGSVLTNKYAEGYPGHRFYGGCEDVDIIEDIARERAKKLFGAEFANVQPHSGAQANLAVLFALANPGEKIMGMNLACGGHLSHGSPANISGKYFEVVPYGINDDGYIDYDEFERLARTEKPKLIIAGASAYPRIIDFQRMADIAHDVGAYFMADIAHIAGLVVTGLHPSPVPCADVVTTTTHKTLRGPRGGLILCKEELGKKINSAVFPGIQGGPLMHVIAGKAVCFGEALDPSFTDYQQRVVSNAKALAKGLLVRNIDLVSGGTDNHLMLADLRNCGITGKELQNRLDDVYITANKNAVPNDPQSPFVTSGLRFGTPAATTRGLDESDMDKIAEYISLAVTDFDSKKDYIREGVNEICARHPLYK